jgi:hypothetical protein
MNPPLFALDTLGSPFREMKKEFLASIHLLMQLQQQVAMIP